MLVLLGGLIATAAVAFTRDNVARRQHGSGPATAASPRRAAEPDASVGVTHARSDARAGPRPDAATAREEAGSSIGVARGRSTLGSVPRADSASGDGVPTRSRSRLRSCARRGRPDAPELARGRCTRRRDRSAGSGEWGDEDSSSRTVEQSQLDARPRIRAHRGVLVGARGGGGRRSWRRSPPPRCSSSCRPSSPGIGGCSRGTSCSVSSSGSCCSSRSGATRWRSLCRSAWSSIGSRSRSSCSCGWRRCSSIRPFAFGALHSMRRWRSSSSRLSAPSPSTIGRVAPLATAVLKGVTLFLSFIIFFYFISSVVTTVAGVVVVTKFLVSGVAVVAFFAIVEQRTGFNVFDHVRSVFPFVQFEGSITSVRFGLIRAVGSADHPIALGVLFAMSVPARSRTREVAVARLVASHARDAHRRARDCVSDADPGDRRRRRSPSCGFARVTSFLSCR